MSLMHRAAEQRRTLAEMHYSLPGTPFDEALALAREVDAPYLVHGDVVHDAILGLPAATCEALEVPTHAEGRRVRATHRSVRRAHPKRPSAARGNRRGRDGASHARSGEGSHGRASRPRVEIAEAERTRGVCRGAGAMTYARLGADGHVYGFTDEGPASATLIEIPDGTSLPAIGQRYDGTTFVDDPAWLAAQFAARVSSRIDAVSSRTVTLLATGIEYPTGAGKFIALDAAGESDLTVVMVAILAGLPWVPIAWPYTDGVFGLALPDAPTFEALYAAALTYGRNTKLAGGALIASLLACTTQAELDAIVDSR